ncbi:DUF6882 domain-containing protein [Nocardia sp. NPDC003693]
MSFARGVLGGAIEQHMWFSGQIPPGRTGCSVITGIARIGEREFTRSGQLGSFAEDLTFMWTWAKPDTAGRPGAEHSARLRDIGLRHDIPEFTTELVDLGGFHDPKLAADHLALICMGALGARGMTKFNHGGRAYTYLVTDDESVTRAEPDPAQTGSILRIAAELLPGGGARAVISGYAHGRGLPVRVAPAPEIAELTLPGDYRLAFEIDEWDTIADVAVFGPDGRAFAPAPAPSQPDRRGTPFVPDALLAALAPAVPIVAGHRGDTPGYGDPALFDAEPRGAEIGHFDPETETWTWATADWAGSAAVRALAVEHGAPQLSTDRVDLSHAPVARNLATLLATAAVRLGDGRGLQYYRRPGRAGYSCYAVTDPDVEVSPSDPDIACQVIEHAADVVNPLTDPANRYSVMREMIVGYFRHHGLPVLYVAEPELLMAHFGLYEVRAEFGIDGSLIRAGYGLVGGIPL